MATTYEVLDAAGNHAADLTVDADTGEATVLVPGARPDLYPTVAAAVDRIAMVGGTVPGLPD